MFWCAPSYPLIGYKYYLHLYLDFLQCVLYTGLYRYQIPLIFSKKIYLLSPFNLITLLPIKGTSIQTSTNSSIQTTIHLVIHLSIQQSIWTTNHSLIHSNIIPWNHSPIYLITHSYVLPFTYSPSTQLLIYTNLSFNNLLTLSSVHISPINSNKIPPIPTKHPITHHPSNIHAFQ